MLGIEVADQPVQSQGGFPNLEQQGTPRAGATNCSRPIHGGVVAFVFGAAAVKFAGSDLQRFLKEISRLAACHLRAGTPKERPARNALLRLPRGAETKPRYPCSKLRLGLLDFDHFRD